MLRLTLGAPTPTPSQDQVLPALAPTLARSVVPILVPTRDLHRTREEAKGRVGTIGLDPGHMGTTAPGQGHPPTEGTTHDHGLQCFEASLPLNELYLRGKEKGSILTDTEKFHPTI